MMHYGPYTVSQDLQSAFKLQAETINTYPMEYKAARETLDVLRSIDVNNITEKQREAVEKCFDSLTSSLIHFDVDFKKDAPYYQEIGYTMARVLQLWIKLIRADKLLAVENRFPVHIYYRYDYFRRMFNSQFVIKQDDDAAQENVNNMIESGIWNVDPIIVENEM